jgi:hypothetical protein
MTLETIELSEFGLNRSALIDNFTMENRFYAVAQARKPIYSH